MKPTISTISDLHKVMENLAWSVTRFTGGDFSVYVDNVEENWRLCIDYKKEFNRIDIRHMSDYCAENHCWNHFGKQERIEFANKRGLKALNDWFSALCVKLFYYNKQTAAIYRRNGEWTK